MIDSDAKSAYSRVHVEFPTFTKCKKCSLLAALKSYLFWVGPSATKPILRSTSWAAN